MNENTLTPQSLSINAAAVAEHLEDFIRSNVASFKADGAVVGVSGGLDSSVVLALCARAIGPDRLLGLTMPERDSSPESETDARLLADQFQVKLEKIDLTPILDLMGIYDHIPKPVLGAKGPAKLVVRSGYKLYTKLSGRTPFLDSLHGSGSDVLRRANAYYRIKHRLRMVLLYSYGERHNYLVAGTANKTELMTGFFVKYGDSAADIMPIIDLYKTQVRELARYLQIPDPIIKKAPSPDLIPGITDEIALGVKFEVLDLILEGLAQNLPVDALARQIGTSPQTVKYVQELVKASELMRAVPIRPAPPGH